MAKSKKLPVRTIMVGCDEQCAEVRITDQATLRDIAEIVNLIPAKRKGR